MKRQTLVSTIVKRMNPGRAFSKLLILVVLLSLAGIQPGYAAGGNSITSPAPHAIWSSLALDSNGYPVVSYYDYLPYNDGDLKVLHCNDVDCAGGDESITAPDTDGDVGWSTSLVLDSNGYPVVSYYDVSNAALKVLHCNDADCSGGDESITSPDTSGIGLGTSLALDSSGYPVVSYWGYGDLKVLHCNDADCAGGDESITVADPGGSVGNYSSLALDSNGFPVVSYQDFGNGDLKVLHCNDADCAGGDESITAPDTAGYVGDTTSLALDSNGFPVVSYWDFSNGDLKLLHCNDADCSGGDESIIAPDTGGNVGVFTSLALDSNGFPVVSYSDYGQGDLKLLHCNDADCAGGDESITIADTAGGDYTSLALDSNGFPVVSYQDFGNGDLKLLHCGSADCVESPNTAPTADPSGPYLGAVNASIQFDGSASSDPDGDSLTYAWDFGDGSNGSGDMPTHTYTATGIYDVCLTVNDGTVDSAQICTIAVVYDPSAGFVTGGGWIDSPAGAYIPDESLAGKATFGFVSKYKKGASVPTGTTAFAFDLAGLEFHSESYEWLVVNQGGTNAQFKGSGTINEGLDPNGNPYKFMLWAGDGNPDTFRIKIWWEDNGAETVVYDNGIDQPIGGGNIVVHKGK